MLIFVFMIVIIMIGGFTAMNSKSEKKTPLPTLELLSNKPKAAIPLQNSVQEEVADEQNSVQEEVADEQNKNSVQEEVADEQNNTQEKQQKKITKMFNLEDKNNDVEELIPPSVFFQNIKQKQDQKVK